MVGVRLAALTLGINCGCYSDFVWRKLLSPLELSISTLSTNSYIDWSSPTLPKLTTDESYAGITITPEAASWVASGSIIGVALGSPIAAWLLDKIGRKKALLLGGVLLTVPWIILSFPVHAAQITAARILAGLGGSFSIMIVPLYIGEITDKDIRGKLTIANMFVSACGSVLTLAVGPFVPYVALNALCAFYAILFILTFLFAPESPYYLIKTKQLESARKSLCRLYKNANSDYIDRKFMEIVKTVENDMQNPTPIKELFLRRDYRKSLTIVIGLRTLHQFSGIFTINSYMQTIAESSNTDIPSNWVSVLYGVIQIPTVLLSAFLVDRIGRKPLLCISSTGAAIILTTLGAYFYLQAMTTANMDSLDFLPILCLTLYAVMMSTGIQHLPFVIFGEVLATNVKRAGGLLFTLYGASLGVVTVKVFNPDSGVLGYYGTFWFFASFCVLGTLFGLFVLPETKNKSFEEIQNKLNVGKSKKSINCTTR